MTIVVDTTAQRDAAECSRDEDQTFHGITLLASNQCRTIVPTGSSRCDTDSSFRDRVNPFSSVGGRCISLNTNEVAERLHAVRTACAVMCDSISATLKPSRFKAGCSNQHSIDGCALRVAELELEDRKVFSHVIGR
jgi:hypothetical protein